MWNRNDLNNNTSLTVYQMKKDASESHGKTPIQKLRNNRTFSILPYVKGNAE